MYGFELAELIKKFPGSDGGRRRRSAGREAPARAEGAGGGGRRRRRRRAHCTQLLSGAARWLGGREATSQ